MLKQGNASTDDAEHTDFQRDTRFLNAKRHLRNLRHLWTGRRECGGDTVTEIQIALNG